MTNAAEKRHLDRVGSLGCALCRRIGYGETPAEVHHIREGQGAAQRAQNWLTIPLCPTHHRGDHGIHGDRKSFRNAAVDELDLLSDTIALIYGSKK